MINLEDLRMRPSRLVRLALQDHYHTHKCAPQKVVLSVASFKDFVIDLETEPSKRFVREDPTFIRADGCVVFEGVPVCPSIRPVIPYLIDCRGRMQEL